MRAHRAQPSAAVRRIFRSPALLSLACVAATATGALRAQCSTQWEQVPPPNGQVRAITQWDPDGVGPLTPRMVVGGQFSLAGGIAVTNIASFDPASRRWSALGSGLGGEVLALAAGPGGELYAGGSFVTSGATTVNHVARWNGTAWVPLGSGLTLPAFPTSVAVHSLTLHGTDLVAAGRFSDAGGVTANSIARWNGSTWASLGGGLVTAGFPATGYALSVLPNGELVVGGDFATADGVLCNNVALWNGATFVAFGAGIAGPVLAIHPLVFTPSGTADLVVAGNFASAGGVAANSIARWSFGSGGWQALGSGLLYNGTQANVFAITTLLAGELLVGGQFSDAGGVAVNHAARWSAGTWSADGSSEAQNVLSLANLPTGEVIAGGSFDFGGSTVVSIATLRSTCPPQVGDLGGGCGSSGGSNRLAAATLPWVGTNFVTVGSGVPAFGFGMALTAQDTLAPSAALPAPAGVGCGLEVQNFVVTNSVIFGGSITFSTALPVSAGLQGLTLFQQAILLDTDSTYTIWNEFTSTNVLKFLVGQY